MLQQRKIAKISIKKGIDIIHTNSGGLLILEHWLPRKQKLNMCGIYENLVI